MSAIAALLAAVLAAPSPWRPIGGGLERRSEAAPGLVLEAVRVDPRRTRVRVALASGLGRRTASVRELALAGGARAAINGGFFDRDERPIGLRVADGRAHGRLNPGLGALVVEPAGRVRVVLGREVGALEDVAELVQSGPRLVVAGRPNRLKPQVARRSAAGVDGRGRLVVVVTGEGVMAAEELAQRLAAPESEGGFALIAALNLDGGGSSQMWVAGEADGLDVPGSTGVADALLLGEIGPP